MDFLEEIRKLSDEELEETVKNKIKKLEEEAISNSDIIGYHLNYNPDEYHIIDERDEGIYFDFDVSCFYSGYIKKNTKMVYGFCFDTNGIVSNDGKYYYVDTDDYILEFCKFIREKEIGSEFDLFDYLLEFIKKYLGYFGNRDRSQMFQMIYKGDREYYDPIVEHGFSWFKGQGNGMCTEYSLMVQNILSVFDMDCNIFIGREETEGEKGENHAFNIVSYVDSESGEEVTYLMDFANCCEIFDEKFKLLDYSPFIVQIDDFSDELLEDFIRNSKHLIYEDYDYILLGDNLIMISYDRNRNYFIPSDILVNGERRDYGEGLQYNKTISR